MIKTSICSLGTFFAIGLFSSFSPQLSSETTEKPQKQYYQMGAHGEFEVTQGYRQDNLNSSISKHKKNPKRTSKVSFRDVRIYQTRIASKFTMNDYFLKIGLGYGDIRSGHVHGSQFKKADKKENDRAKVRGSYTADAKLSWGKNFALGSTVTIAPLVGYLWEIEKLRFKNGRQIKEGHSKRLHDLNSTYKARWNAPFIGLDASYDPLKKLSVYGEYNFLFAVKDHARGFWNLRSHQHGMHFEQRSRRSKGFGHFGLAGVGYEWIDNLWLKLEYQFLWLEAKGGKTKGKEHHHKFSSPFHKSRLMSQEVRLCVEYAM